MPIANFQLPIETRSGNSLRNRQSEIGNRGFHLAALTIQRPFKYIYIASYALST